MSELQPHPFIGVLGETDYCSHPSCGRSFHDSIHSAANIATTVTVAMDGHRQLFADFIRNHVRSDIDNDTMEDVLDVFEVQLHALNVMAERNKKYRGIWRRAGWMANLMQVCHKTDRLMTMFWMDPNATDGKEADLDDAIDLMNYNAFFIITNREGDARGSRW